MTRLSEFLRYTLDQDPMKKVTLRQEIEALDLYLGTERLRFGERLRLEYAIEDAALDALVPSLLLQPLLENSLKYAVSSREQGGMVRIEGRTREGLLELSVIDDGPGLREGAAAERAARRGPAQHARASGGAVRRQLPLRGTQPSPGPAGRDGAAARDGRARRARRTRASADGGGDAPGGVRA